MSVVRWLRRFRRARRVRLIVPIATFGAGTMVVDAATGQELGNVGLRPGDLLVVERIDPYHELINTAAGQVPGIDFYG